MLIARHSLKPAKILPTIISAVTRTFSDYQDVVITINGSGPITYVWSYTSSMGNFSSGVVTSSSNVITIYNQYRTFGNYVYANHTLTLTNRYGSSTPAFYGIFS